LRIPYADVVAKAAVLLTPTKTACCVKPWIVADRWDDTTPIAGYPAWRDNKVWNGESFEDSNDNGLYDPGEAFTDGNRNGVYDSEYYDRALSQANEAGYIPSLPPDGHIGDPVILKVDPKGDQAAASFFNPIILPWPEEYDMGNRGADLYEESIRACNPTVLDPSEELKVESEPGNMVQKTIKGVKSIIEKDPYAYWNEEIHNVDHEGGGDIGVSSRIVLVPVFDPRIWPRPGRQTVVVTKIVAFFIEGIDKKSNITARVTTAPISCIKGSQPGGGESFTWTFQMVE
jgi:hypothetical protein